MTAELVLFNPLAVAMAADSTLSTPNGKLFHSANKIFALSHRHPIGVMYYQGSEFMGVPWETLIKLYRPHVPPEGFPTVSAYRTSFLDFLTNMPATCSDTVRHGHVAYTLQNAWATICDQAMRQVLSDGEGPESKKARSIVENVILQRLAQLESKEARRLGAQHAPFTLEHEDVRAFESRYRNLAIEIATDCLAPVYGKVPKRMHKNVLCFSAHLVMRSAASFREHPAGSGLVFAGFGSEQVYPEVTAVEVQGVPIDGLLVQRDVVTEPSAPYKSKILPFAQSDVTTAFMHGADTDLFDAYDWVVAETSRTTTDTLLALVKASMGGNSDAFRALETKVKSGMETSARTVSQRMRTRIQDSKLQPLLQVLRNLQKDELAQAAETLINLTKLRRRLSDAQETVGGDVDVAVISKGDGFIWVKRKHYFSADLNPHFLHRRGQEII